MMEPLYIDDNNSNAIPRPRTKDRSGSIYSKPVYVIVVVCLTILALSIISDFILNFNNNNTHSKNPNILNNLNILNLPETSVGDSLDDSEVESSSEDENLDSFDDSSDEFEEVMTFTEELVGLKPIAPNGKHVEKKVSNDQKKTSNSSGKKKSTSTHISTKKTSSKKSTKKSTSSKKSPKKSTSSKKSTKKSTSSKKSPKKSTSSKKSSKKVAKSTHSSWKKSQHTKSHKKKTITHTVSILYYKPYSSLLSRAEKVAKEIELRNDQTRIVLTPYDKWVDVNELLELEKHVDCFLGIGVSGQLLMQKLNKVVVTREPSCVDADTNYQGATIGSVITVSIAGCKKACVGLETCEFWSTHPRDFGKTTEYYCELKTDKKKKKHMKGYISGPKECPHSIYQKLDNKHEMVDFEFVPKGFKNNIHQIPTLYVTNTTEESVVQTFMNKHKYEKYILKQENGAGANKMEIVHKAIEATKVQYGHGGFYIMQPFIWPHKQLSMNFMAYEGRVEGMLLSDCDGGQNPEIMVKLGYMCALVPDNAWFAPKIKAFVKEFAKHNHVSGMMGFDFMLAGKDLYLLEVNPRVTGIESMIDRRGASIYWDRILSRYFEHCGIPMRKDGAPYEFYKVKDQQTGKHVDKLYATPWWYYYIKAMTKKAYLPELQRKMNKFVMKRSDAVLVDIFSFEPNVLNALESICFECKLVMDFILNGHDGPPKLRLFGPRSASDLRASESEEALAELYDDVDPDSDSSEFVYSEEGEETLDNLLMMNNGEGDKDDGVVLVKDSADDDDEATSYVKETSSEDEEPENSIDEESDSFESDSGDEEEEEFLENNDASDMTNVIATAEQESKLIQDLEDSFEVKEEKKTEDLNPISENGDEDEIVEQNSEGTEDVEDSSEKDESFSTLFEDDEPSISSDDMEEDEDINPFDIANLEEDEEEEGSADLEDDEEDENLLPVCECSTTWSVNEPGCESEQKGCPVESCNGDGSNRWCMLVKNPCKQKEGLDYNVYLIDDYMDCGDDTPVFGIESFSEEDEDEQEDLEEIGSQESSSESESESNEEEEGEDLTTEKDHLEEEEDVLKKNVSFDEALNADLEAEIALASIFN